MDSAARAGSDGADRRSGRPSASADGLEVHGRPPEPDAWRQGTASGKTLVYNLAVSRAEGVERPTHGALPVPHQSSCTRSAPGGTGAHDPAAWMAAVDDGDTPRDERPLHPRERQPRHDEPGQRFTWRSWPTTPGGPIFFRLSLIVVDEGASCAAARSGSHDGHDAPEASATGRPLRRFATMDACERDHRQSWRAGIPIDRPQIP